MAAIAVQGPEFRPALMDQRQLGTPLDAVEQMRGNRFEHKLFARPEKLDHSVLAGFAIANIEFFLAEGQRKCFTADPAGLVSRPGEHFLAIERDTYLTINIGMQSMWAGAFHQKQPLPMGRKRT